MLIRATHYTPLINTLERQQVINQETAQKVRQTWEAGQSQPFKIIDPLATLKKSLKGIASSKEITVILQKAAEFISNQQIARNLGNALLTLARGSKKQQPVIATEPIPKSSPYRRLSQRSFKILRTTPLAKVVETAHPTENLYIVLDTDAKADELKKKESLYGAKIIPACDTKSGQAIPKKDSVVVHMGVVRQVINRTQGEFNPLDGDLNALKWIEGNKWREYLIAKDFMPASVNAKDLILQDPIFSSKQEKVRALLSEFHQHPTSKKEIVLQGNVQDMVNHFMAMSSQLFPAGAFVKYVGECQTGDKNQLITTNQVRHYGRSFVVDLKEAQALDKRRGFTHKDIQAELSESSRSATQLVRSLLLNPADIMVQEKAAIAKARDGQNKEFRIDVVQGVPVNSTLRYSYDVDPQGAKDATQFVAKFFAQCDDKWRTLPCGVDVAMLENGEFVLIEFNFGVDSGYIDAADPSVDANRYISRLQGRATRLMKMLENAFKKGVQGQQDFLKAQKDIEIESRKNLEDLGILGPAAYFRDRWVEQWQRNPTKKNAKVILKNIHTMLEPVKKHRSCEARILYKCVEGYFKDQLEAQQG